ncbi:U3 small nucleolar RNA-associated protein 6 homolog [Anopheles stephensi]|uniref:U3 small nucleolar RNA-associated protein 6 homolog n=1 Tax=Anopheles stephensi TaxID=30069 RepID=UPI0007D5EFDF|nr:U3 small nucleolar RNA-associated protein 6 homolog [Anopheles stephensi]
MSELIEFRREQTIREYECMKHLKLFTDQEVQSIKDKRNYHDYKIERRTKKLADFINFIAYECNLYELLRQRRRRLHIDAEWVSLEKSIHNRIRVLYKRAMVRFASDYRVWTHFLQYCKRRRFFTEGSRVLGQMLGYHGDKPKAWLCAIEWEYRQAKNMARVKHYTLRGLQRHPECRELCVNFIKIQMEEAMRIVRKTEEDKKYALTADGTEKTKALKTAHLVYKNFEHKDVAFFGELLQVLKKYGPVSNKLAKQAITEMRSLLADKEEMWHLLANLVLESSEFVAEESAKPAEALEKCLEIYQEALDRLPTKKMHSLCIDTLLELNSTEDQTIDQKSKRKALANAFKRALVADLLEQEKMLQYLKLLLHNSSPKEEQVMSVINKGLEQYPACIEIWQSYMRYLMIHKDVAVDELDAVFRKAITSLPERVSRLPLWKMLFHYYGNRADLFGSMEQLFRRAIDQGPEISHHFQPLFLDYLMLKGKNDITKVRAEYQRMVKNYTTTLDLHRKMANLEATQTPPDVNEWRQCHENATQFYGKTEPTVWLQYAQFERDHGKPQHMQSLYERAKAALDEESFATFMTEYELIRNPYIVRY